MKQKLLVVFFLTFSFLVKAQNAQDLIDGLKNDLKANPDAKKRATIYSDLTWYYTNISTDSAAHYGNKALAESKKLNDSTLMAQVYSDLGAVYFRKGNYQDSRKNYETAYKIRKARNDVQGMAKVNMNLGNLYNKEGKNDLALKSFLNAIEYFDKANNQSVVSIAKSNVGLIFQEIKNYPKAKKYLNDAIAYQEKNNQDSGLCTSYLTLGNVYLKMKDTLNALKFYEKSIVSSKKAGNNISLSSALNNIGSIKSEQRKSKEAIALFNQSKRLRDSINLEKDESILSLSLAKEHIMYRRFPDARELLLKLKKSYTNKESDKENLLQTYQYLIHTYAFLNQPDSVNLYNNLSSRIQNEIIEASVAKQTNELETKYQTTKKEKLLLEKEVETKRKNVIIGTISLLAIFIGLIGYLIYRQQKIKNKQQEQEFELKSAISKIETQNKLQEQRLSISRDLHDNIGSQLTFIISSVDNIKYAFDLNNTKLDNKLSNISEFAKSTIVELRDTIWAMNTSEFTFEDLRSRIFNFIEKAKSAKEEVDFKFNVDNSLKDEKFTSIIGINLYRTIQEAINNGIKYAEANEIKVNILKQNNQIKIEIQDNGKGFDLETVNFGNGLHNMKKRIEEIKGEIIVSSSEMGTKVEVLI